MTGKLVILTIALCVAYVACDDICKGQEHGSFQQDSKNCSKYYQCVNGKGVSLTCPNDYYGKMKINAPESLCTGLDGVFLADPKVCARYYVCAKGYAVQKSCGGSLLWNDALKYCDFPQNVDCGDAAVEKPHVESDEICKDQPNGSYHEDYKNCSKYYQCVNGTAKSLTCPNDYLWKDENKWCDFPYNVDCGSRPNPHPAPESLCSGLDGVFLADPENCSKYYICAKGYAVSKACGGNLLWNDAMKYCDQPGNVDVGETATGKPQPTHKPEENGCPAVDGASRCPLAQPADALLFQCFRGTKSSTQMQTRTFMKTKMNMRLPRER
ncbi:protein obstructor-E-like [Ctenocephalides felis]|uniref:protein obstructor-E-like n=1 Tax=Ctenocephalides felis TaxID=7515 RepID=UPI000E6E24F4|nr:protein obstructor-E-like [Ctenocephalides felis]